MSRQCFRQLQSHLLASGIPFGHVRRITAELGDHLEDLRLEAINDGMEADAALVEAKQRLGCQKEIAERMLAQTEFKHWIYRHPRVARVYLPIAYAILLPAAPVLAGLANPFMVARWGAALMLSGVVTAGMLLCMQLAIVLN